MSGNWCWCSQLWAACFSCCFSDGTPYFFIFYFSILQLFFSLLLFVSNSLSFDVICTIDQFTYHFLRILPSVTGYSLLTDSSCHLLFQFLFFPVNFLVDDVSLLKVLNKFYPEVMTTSPSIGRQGKALRRLQKRGTFDSPLSHKDSTCAFSHHIQSKMKGKTEPEIGKIFISIIRNKVTPTCFYPIVLS